MAATIQWFAGAEIGSLNEFNRSPVGNPSSGGSQPTAQTSIKRTGSYAVKCPQDGLVKSTVTNLAATVFVRFYFKASAFPTHTVPICGFATSNAFAKVNLMLNTNGTLGWFFGTIPSSSTTSGATPIDTSGWNFIEIKFFRDASAGGLEVFLNGVLQFSDFTSSPNTTAGTAATTMIFYFGNDLNQNGSQSGEDMYFDDMAVATGAYIGAGGSIAVQGKAGSPTYDAWTKNGDTTAALCWSETPFSTGKNCSDTTPTDRQTMLVNDTILNSLVGAGDTINAAFILSIAKAATSGSLKTTRRIGGVDTDGADRGLAITDTAFPNQLNGDDLNIFTDTRANLGAAEIGFVRGATGSGNAATVEDVWLLVDFTPNPNISITPSAGALVVTGQILTVTDSDSPKIRPNTGTLNLVGRQPGSNHKTPGAGSLGLVGGRARVFVASALTVTFNIADTVPRFPLLVSFDIENLSQPPTPLTVKFDIQTIDGDPLTVTFDILGDIVNRRLKNDVQGPVARVVLK